VTVDDSTRRRKAAGRLVESISSPPGIATVVWAGVWWLLTLTGQTYSLRALYAGYQIVPAEALLDDPLGSVWYLHIQPPTWNLLLGTVGGWSPFGLETSYQLLTLACGVVLASTLCATLGHLGAPRGWAIGLSLPATLTTQVLSHAFEPRYDFAVAAMLSALVWSVVRVDDARSR